MRVGEVNPDQRVGRKADGKAEAMPHNVLSQ
jgi:hypothetical protein